MRYGDKHRSSGMLPVAMASERSPDRAREVIELETGSDPRGLGSGHWQGETSQSGLPGTCRSPAPGIGIEKLSITGSTRRSSCCQIADRRLANFEPVVHLHGPLSSQANRWRPKRCSYQDVVWCWKFVG